LSPPETQQEPKSFIIARICGSILLHCQRTPEIFDKKDTNLIGMNFFDLMSIPDKKFFKKNCLWDHYLFEEKDQNVVVKSSECLSRTIRFATPYNEDVQLSDINVLTSKVVSCLLNLVD
jgi:hypothetical protein